MSKLWSAMPHKAYSINVNGQQVGLGMRDIWDQVPGAWNILQLVWGQQCEELLPYQGLPEEFPYDCGFVSYSVCMALQTTAPTKNWGDIAIEFSPRKFIEMLRAHVDCEKFVLPLVFKQVFWERAEVKAASYYEYSDNVIRADFRSGEVNRHAKPT